MGYECTFCMIDMDSAAPRQTGGLTGSNQQQHKKREDLSEVCVTPCGHMFHRACLERWFKEKAKRKCPICQTVVHPKGLIRMHPPRSTDERTGITDDNVPATSNVSHMAKGLKLQELGIPTLHCDNDECQDLLSVHKTLISDFNNLRTKYIESLDEINLLNAQIKSLETMIANPETNKKRTSEEEPEDEPRGKRSRPSNG